MAFGLLLAACGGTTRSEEKDTGDGIGGTAGGGAASTGGGPSTGGTTSTGGTASAGGSSSSAGGSSSGGRSWSDAGMCYTPVESNGRPPAADCPCLDRDNPPDHTPCAHVNEVCNYNHHLRCWVRDCECQEQPDGALEWVCPVLLC